MLERVAERQGLHRLVLIFFGVVEETYKYEETGVAQTALI